MCRYRLTHGFKLMVRQVMLFCGLFYNFCNSAIMNMAYVRENVVLYLVVKPPVNQFIILFFGAKLAVV